MEGSIRELTPFPADCPGEFVLQRDPLLAKLEEEAHINPKLNLRARMVTSLFAVKYSGTEEAIDAFNELSLEAYNSDMQDVLEESIFLFAADKGIKGMPGSFDDFIIEASGIPTETLSQKWGLGRGADNEDIYKMQNAEAIAQLEAIEPGSAKTLAEEFGIYNFSRYPIDILVEQYHERNNKSIGYGIVSVSTADYAGGFDSEVSKNNLRELFGILKSEGKTLRIYEPQDVKEASRALFAARYKYGQKISHSLLSAHGNEVAMLFHDYYYAETFISTNGINELAETTTRRLKDLFEDNATLVLNACQTGAPGGVGEALSRLLNVNLIAPDEKTFLKSIQKMGGKIIASYDKANALAITPNPSE